MATEILDALKPLFEARKICTERILSLKPNNEWYEIEYRQCKEELNGVDKLISTVLGFTQDNKLT